MTSAVLPIDPLLPQIQSSLERHPRLVLEAPPGAGKTTRVPLALLDAPWLQGRRIVMLEPRRVAARAAASFMAASLGEEVGQTVGYRIRFENRTSATTRIEVVTEGILSRMIQNDPALEGIGAVVFDEFHERHLSGDLGLALALDVQAQLREDLRIVVMSATLEGDKLARFLDAPYLCSPGRSFPVQVAYLPARREESLTAHMRRAVEHALAQLPGDVLAFLPGQREIAEVQRALEAAALPAEVLALHGELAVEAQVAVLQPAPSGQRRVVLATNVAESSVTLPGVRVVIDSGLAREPRFDPNSGFPRLDTVTISQASAQQRAGRAGRVAEGWCYRLWPESQRLEPARRAEILTTELSALALELAAWGSDALRFFDAPPKGAMAAARDLLARLGALDDGRLTDRGRRMLALGTHPRMAAMLVASDDAHEGALACDLAALLEARDPLKGSRRDDVMARWQALAGFRHGRTPTDASRGALAAIDHAARHWRSRMGWRTPAATDAAAHQLGERLMLAFPDRIARQYPNDALRYALASGRSVQLVPDSALYGERWIVVAELRDAERDARVLRAAPLDEAAIERVYPERFISEDRVYWDADQHAIAAHRVKRFDRIELELHPIAQPDPARFADALVDAVRKLGLDALPWTESTRQWRERVRCLRLWLPEAGWPDFSDEALLADLDQWLRPSLVGKRRLDALSEAELATALKSCVDWSQRERVDALAPSRIRVPSGMDRAIHYAHDSEPVLAVKLQELFGLADTPRIAEGRVALTLHLLSPAGRPLQVTRDLKGFWERTYPEVKKEMKGRYPKHPWPDDPWTAVPTHRAKPRT
ncbi:MAG TPA: ATP-dependent helicase HrpB [Chiayiivirga sp.]|nr:ATP-dependent helicase HrpB [Chiayiivirga sp.]